MTGFGIAAALKTTNDLTKDHQKGIFNYIMISWFWPHYLKYLTKSIIIEWVSKAEAEKQIAFFQEDPHPAMAFIQSEAEIEYRNMFWVLGKTIPLIQEPKNEEKQIDPDKMKRLKDLSKEFSSNDMQEVIAGIIAWEYNQPWSFSLRTMDIVKCMSKIEIEMFQNFLWLVFMNTAVPESFFNDDANFKNSWITFNNLTELASLWLISIQNSIIVAPTEQNSSLKIYIGWNEYWFQFHWNWMLRIDGIYWLTRAWKELSNTLKPRFNKFCFDYICHFLSSKQLSIVSK